MAQERKTGMVRAAADVGTSAAKRFTVRFFVWFAIIFGLSTLASEAAWPHVYAVYGPPLAIGQSSTYQAVLFGDLVTGLVGAFSVAFVGTFRR